MTKFREILESSVKVKWAILSYAIVVAMCWVAVTSLYIRQSNLSDDVVFFYGEKVAFDRCQARYVSDTGIRDTLTFLIESDSLRGSAFSGDVLEFINDNVIPETVEDACGLPPTAKDLDLVD